MADTPAQAETFWAFLAQFPSGEEGVVGIPTALGMTPCATASPRVVEVLKERMPDLVKTMGQPIRLVQFDRAEVLEVWEV